jgi:iron(III) transport system substrate-binding protein
VGNFARDPQGGDTDQLRGIASGECGIAMSNTYYYARAIRKGDGQMTPEQLANIGWVFPNQNDIGAHMNISGAGVAANAPNRENAIRFLEYLASDQAQEYFSAGNDEYPAVPGVGLSPSVAALGIFRPDTIALSDIADNIGAAVEVLNEPAGSDPDGPNGRRRGLVPRRFSFRLRGRRPGRPRPGRPPRASGSGCRPRRRPHSRRPRG